MSTLRSSKRGLLLRDTLVFLALCGVTVALFLVTLLLFRSFENHREALGERWAERGRQALQAGHPDVAVAALRTALNYRDTLPEQLMLAEALADAGHVEEATNYFLTLRETRPGDGFINLQLARLERRAGDTRTAVDYYRASIFGGWEGDGAQRRREVRLELAAYLASVGEAPQARDELLIAAGNSPENQGGDVLIGDRFAAMRDAPDALQFYRKALKLEPHDRSTLAKAGRVAYALGQYDEAARWLDRALSEHAPHTASTGDEAQLSALAANARRAPELNLSRDLPATERADHLLLASGIAQKRLLACMAPPVVPAGTTMTGSTPPSPQAASPPLQALRARWATAAPQLKQRTLQRDAALEDSVAQLVNDTEQGTVEPCGTPTGDDALLWMLAASQHTSHP